MKGQDTMIYVGIDVASNKHDCFIMRNTGEVFSKKSFTIKNDIEDIKNSTIQSRTLWSLLKIQMCV